MNERFHPAEYIREEMQERKWTPYDLALRMTIPQFHLNLLAVEMYLACADEDFSERDNVRLGEMAEQFAQAFGVSPDFFANLERAFLDKGNAKPAAESR